MTPRLNDTMSPPLSPRIITKDTRQPTDQERRADFRKAAAGIERFQLCYVWPWLKQGRAQAAKRRTAARRSLARRTVFA